MLRAGLFRDPEHSENTILDSIIEWINENDESVVRADFEFMSFNDEQLTKLADGLKNNTHLDTLNLFDADITSDQHALLIEALKENNSIKKLILPSDICENLREQYMNAVKSDTECHSLS